MLLAAAAADGGPGAERVGAAASPRLLTQEQLGAVERRRGALALSAAAGSGKTSVLVERFVAAVRVDGLLPAQILAITFTERAAAELRERVRARFLELGERAAARDTEAAFVSTFHGFCARLLRSHALQAGVDPDFEILDEGLAGSLRLRSFTRALGEFVAGGEEQAVDLAAAYGPDRLRTMIEGAHAALRSLGQLHPRLPTPAAGPPEAMRARALLERLLEHFTAAYEDAKRRRHALDFDDLELLARELLDHHPDIRRRSSERFELLMVDEFQDTNRRQLDILDGLARENLFTVGDEQQAIYAFRHADVRLFRARNEQLEPAGAVLELTRNFRSRPAVLAVIATIFRERLPSFSAPVAAREEVATPAAVELLVTDKCGWEEHPALVREIGHGLPRAPSWRQAEARVLASRLAGLVSSGEVRAGEIAVLLRALGDIHVYERALQLAGLRTIAAAGAFWEQRQVGDLIAYLRALANPLDELALYGALASPLAAGSQGAGVRPSRTALALLARAARAHGRGAFDTALEEDLLVELPPAQRAAVHGFCVRIRDERAELPRRSLSELLERALERSAYRQRLIGSGGGERGVANLNKLLRLARRFEAREGRDLRGFLDHVSYLEAAGRGGESEAPVEGVEPDAVRLMSIHAAKGLEFPVVCVADLGRAPNTRVPDLLVDGDRIGLNLVTLASPSPTAVLGYEELSAARRQQEAEEEDRIAYVAMTRARDRLILSGAIELERWPERRHGASALGWIGPAIREDLPVLAWSAFQEGRGELELAGVRILITSPASGAPLPPEAPPERPAPASAPAQAGSSRAGEQLVLEIGAPPQAAAAGVAFELPRALSFSSLGDLERCGYRYYLERVLRLPEEERREGGPGRRREKAGLGPRERGILVHRLLEQVDFARPRAPSPQRVQEAAAELALSALAAEAIEIAAEIAEALRAEPARRAGAARLLRREHPFAFSLARPGAAAGSGEPLVSGVIDLLAEERDGGMLVLDYKSNAVAAGEDLAALVEREYSLQRELYALAVLLGGAPSVEIVHWFLAAPERHVAVRYAARERGSLEAVLTARLARARRVGFAVSARPHRGLCLGCPGRAGLCSWPSSETLRELPGDT